jgi:uncharacterized protein (DUF924 family)
MEHIRDELIDYWFGPSADDAEAAQGQAKLWWGHDPDTDLELEERFGTAATAAASTFIDHWVGGPRGRLALILLLDQLPRAIHRGTPAAYAMDDKALEVAKGGLASGADRLLRPIQRVFFYLPFEHAENVDEQARSVELFRELAAGVREEWRPTFENYVDFALRHQAIIDRFGRFPHRNAILGRESTPEEIEFLKEPGSGF